jgi:hypothetical protein
VTRNSSTSAPASTETAPARIERLVAGSTGWVAVVAIAVVVGVTLAVSPIAGLALAGLVLVVGVLVADPILLAVIVLPGSVLIQRVGGTTTNLSVADLLVLVGGIVCLFQIRWSEAHYLRRFLAGIVWYEAVLILVVVDHPFRGDMIEWFHRLSYLAGSVLVGWVVATHGRARQAVQLFLLASSVLAVITIEHAFTLHFHPAQWGVYQKNAIGSVLWIAIAVAQINPPWLGLDRTQARIAKYLCLGGLLACQSRQSAILLVVAVATAVVLNPEVRRRSKLIVLAAVPVLGLVYYSLELAARNNPKFNSVAIRFGQIGAAVHVWHLSPILGQGLRFYNLPQFVTVTPPPNVFVDNLASDGLLGSLAFVGLVIFTIRVLLRLPRIYGTLGVAILVAHYVHGLFDTFWIGSLCITPFVIVGICLGMADAHRNDPDELPAGGLVRQDARRVVPADRERAPWLPAG